MNRLFLSSALCTLAGALIANGQVPSLINYQGRLTDAAGAPVTGNKNFSISLYDAATAGNLLYTESIGAVTLDANGVYSFQFGGTGTSNSQVTETLATTDAATLVYTKALANTGIVENSITVTDGTNTWSQSVGNPGVGATATANTIVGFVIGATITNGGSGYTSPPAVTIIGNGSGAAATAVLTEGVVTGITITSAGSGYTGTPTISIAPPVIPFRVDYSAGTITATYSAAPTAGAAIIASYRYGTNGITGALSSGAEHWMAVSVDGVMQGTRQRVLAVPFASLSQASMIAESVKPQPTSWRPQLFATKSGAWQNAGTVPGATTMPFGPGFWGGWTVECAIPKSYSSLSELRVSYWMNQVYGGLNSGIFISVKILEVRADGSEVVVSEKIFVKEAGLPFPGNQKKIVGLKLDINPDLMYKLRVEIGNDNNSVGLRDIVVSGISSFGDD